MASNEVWVKCHRCGNTDTKHGVVANWRRLWDEDSEGRGADVYQVVRCKGCGSVRFRMESFGADDAIDPYTGEQLTHVEVYPSDAPMVRGAKVESADLPGKVQRIYRETLSALNAGCDVLAAAGLRAMAEAICLSANVEGADLQARIESLVTKGVLGRAQANQLHEQRYLGNTALHELEPPSRQNVEDGLQIIEALLETMYVAEARANRMRRDRDAREHGPAATIVPFSKKE